MKTQDIKNMGHAYLSVLEAMKKKLDPVDKDELKGDHKDRKDKDIDNDGDADESDVYLHNRRKTISKASKGKEVEATESVKEQLDHSHAKQVANSIAKSNKNLKVTSSAGEHFVHHKDDPEGESGHISVKAAGGQLHVSHEMGQAHGNKKFKDTSSAVAHGVRVSSGAVSEAVSPSGVLNHSHAKQVANSIAKSNKNLKVSSSGNRHFVHHKDDPEGESGYVSVHSSNGQLHVSHEMGQAHGNKKFNDARSATAHGVRVTSGGVSEAWSVSEAKKMSISAKQIKNALSSAKAQAKPKDQVSLKKAPFDIPKEGKEWTVLNRIQEKADAKISHTKGATEPEKMGSTASKGEMGFVDAHGGLTGTDAAIDGAKAAEFTANAATKNVKVAPGRPNDQKGGDKNIVKAGTEVKESALARLKNYIRR